MHQGRLGVLALLLHAANATNPWDADNFSPRSRTLHPVHMKMTQSWDIPVYPQAHHDIINRL